VRRGTATAIADDLQETGWQIGGKTGTGPGPAPIGPQSDGWFAGLLFDRSGTARYTIAVFVRHGGPGGGNAAQVAAAVSRYIVRPEDFKACEPHWPGPAWKEIIQVGWPLE
jgi:cell division protein FtsI/penicillin-binding protein 2